MEGQSFVGHEPAAHRVVGHQPLFGLAELRFRLDGLLGVLRPLDGHVARVEGAAHQTLENLRRRRLARDLEFALGKVLSVVTTHVMSMSRFPRANRFRGGVFVEFWFPFDGQFRGALKIGLLVPASFYVFRVIDLDLVVNSVGDVKCMIFAGEEVISLLSGFRIAGVVKGTGFDGGRTGRRRGVNLAFL